MSVITQIRGLEMLEAADQAALDARLAGAYGAVPLIGSDEFVIQALTNAPPQG